MKAIEKNTFYQCMKLKDVKFSDGLESIGLYAFYQTSLESVELPASLRTVA